MIYNKVSLKQKVTIQQFLIEACLQFVSKRTNLCL